MYDDDGGLYSAGSYVGDSPAVAAAPVAEVPSSDVLIADYNPFSQLPQPGGASAPDSVSPVSVLPPDPASSGPSIPFGLAIVGVLAVAVIWANSLEGGKR